MIEVISPNSPFNSTIEITGSKSISNRLIILNAVVNTKTVLKNISNSRDTLILQNAISLIASGASIIDIEEAGSAMRFLTAYLSCTEGNWILTGSERMKERPIGELVEALKTLGADIQYLENHGYPPLLITGKVLEGNSVKIKASISSQFISALILISPKFKDGLTIYLEGGVVSKSYIETTIDLLKDYNASVKVGENKIVIKSERVQLKPLIEIESDWSSASYWYNLVALNKGSKIFLNHFYKNSTQADSILPTIYNAFGVSTEFVEDGFFITSGSSSVKHFEYDFINCPDIAQTIAVTCLGLGVTAILKGLSTLRIKETDRISALDAELQKFGAIVETTESTLSITGYVEKRDQVIEVKTYNDHRMALSFAPLAIKYRKVFIDNPDVVKKSYPSYWNDLKKLGFLIQRLDPV